jgi:tetratricopeptide (TPR) repeat protein
VNDPKGETEVRPLVAPGTDVLPRAAKFFTGPWPLAFLLLLAVLPYIGILRSDFAYAFDDKILILDSPYVHSFHHLREALTTTLFSNMGAQAGIPYYRPVVKLGFLLCYQLFGPLAFGFHLFSLLLNVAAVGMLFLVAERLLGNRVAAFATATLFALHPVHVEAVAWISAMTDLELTLFCLLAFWCFLRIAAPAGGNRIWAIAAMTMSFVLALLSKELAVTIPLLATIYEHFYRGDRRETRSWQKLLRYGPLWLAFLGYILLRVKLIGSIGRDTGMHPASQMEMILSALAIVGQYLGLLIWPSRLSAFHVFPASISVLAPSVLTGGCALVLCAFLFYNLWRRARPASFGILWLFVTLTPVLNIRWMGAYVLGERFLYLPSVGFCLVTGWACATLWQSSAKRNDVVRTVVIAAACLVVALCVFRIGLRVLDWQDDITLFTQSLRTQPNDFRLHDALGAAYWIRGDWERAEREWQTTLRLEPNSAEPLNSLGVLYAQQKRYDQAMPLLEKAFKLNPNDAAAHLNLGGAYAEMGKMDGAEEQFRAAVFLFPLDFNAHNLLGKLYFDSKRLIEAEQQFRQSLQCEPNLAAYDYLGNIYMEWEDRNRAERAFKAALALKSTDSRAHFNLGLIYAATERNSQAVEELQAALTADPHNAEILAALERLRQ